MAEAISTNATIEKSNAAVTLTMEGETFTMQQQDLNPQPPLNFDGDNIQFNFYTNESIVSIDFNLTNTEIIKKGKASYTIPDANLESVKVDLSFFNKNRDASRINKRVVFKKGEITIEKCTKTELKMSFKGEGSGMTERNLSFPISGSINAKF
ncbi:hypothetical protein GCM10023330_15740 [Litoribaculum gwangyangense]|uniref:Uncharacterized protein n=2 Tax=Litoribaculum gwangyangense TaxID=1130722 RepID=A0ABP9CJY5_9FLAO